MNIQLITTVAEIKAMAQHHESKTGYLELIAGPMYSGKTSKILELYKQYTFCGIKCLVINWFYTFYCHWHSTYQLARKNSDCKTLSHRDPSFWIQLI